MAAQIRPTESALGIGPFSQRAQKGRSFVPSSALRLPKRERLMPRVARATRAVGIRADSPRLSVIRPRAFDSPTIFSP